jgi:hypothetical protein
MNNKFDFIYSTRFWAMILGAGFLYLEAKGWIGEAERNLFVTIAGGFIGIKTIDKNVGEAKVDAAIIASEPTLASQDDIQ